MAKSYKFLTYFFLFFLLTRCLNGIPYFVPCQCFERVSAEISMKFIILLYGHHTNQEQEFSLESLSICWFEQQTRDLVIIHAINWMNKWHLRNSEDNKSPTSHSASADSCLLIKSIINHAFRWRQCLFWRMRGRHEVCRMYLFFIAAYNLAVKGFGVRSDDQHHKYQLQK